MRLMGKFTPNTVF
jgi:hypothetical protein